MVGPVAGTLAALVLLASVLMVLAGVGKKQLLWRSARCPVCHRPPGHCTCGWL